MKYVVLFIAIFVGILVFLVICVLFFLWDPQKFIKRVKENAYLDSRGRILWKETLTDIDYYFKILNIE